MKPGHSILLGAWLTILLNLLMAFGCIGMFLRMAPLIDELNTSNLSSLGACREMLSVLATQDSGETAQGVFRKALTEARANVTETGESELVDRISTKFAGGLDNEINRIELIRLINELAERNRAAVAEAAQNARHFGIGGAWGVVFMALGIFTVGIMFKRRMARELARPLSEIDAVLEARHNGDKLRRCCLPSPSRPVAQVFNGINEVLDDADR
ncbi:MAG: hypothetical protein PHI35_06825 [Victivallaceae bacterium]|nr:hypothetical protein [Victivallaceae bacterium]